MAILRPPASFKRIEILYYALFTGQLLLGLVIFFLMENAGAEREVVAPFSYLIPGAVIAGIAAACYLEQFRNRNLPIHTGLQEKLEHYQVTCLLKYAALEGGNLVALILTYLMADTMYLLWFGCGLAAYAWMKPNEEVFRNRYQVRVGEEVK